MCKREVDAYLGCITCALQSNDFYDLLSMNARRFAETKPSSSYWSTRYRSIVDDQLGAAMDGENSRIVA